MYFRSCVSLCPGSKAVFAYEREKLWKHVHSSAACYNSSIQSCDMIYNITWLYCSVTWNELQLSKYGSQYITTIDCIQMTFACVHCMHHALLIPFGVYTMLNHKPPSFAVAWAVVGLFSSWCPASFPLQTKRITLAWAVLLRRVAPPYSPVCGQVSNSYHWYPPNVCVYPTYPPNIECVCVSYIPTKDQMCIVSSSDCFQGGNSLG